MKLLLTLCLLLGLCLPPCADAAVFTEKMHLSYLQQSPAYRDADRQLNAAWKLLKSVSTPEQMKYELAEQRAWLKARGELMERMVQQNESDVETATLLLLRRLAVLNYKIALKKHDHVRFSIAYDQPRLLDNGNVVTWDVLIMPSKPVVTNWYCTSISKRARNEAINQFLRDKAAARYRFVMQHQYDSTAGAGDAALIDEDITLDFKEMDGVTLTPEASIYLPLQFAAITEYSVDFESRTLAAISSSSNTNLSMARSYTFRGETIFLGLRHGERLAFEDLFEEPDQAIALLRTQVFEQMQAAVRQYDRVHGTFSQGKLENLHDLVAQYDVRYVRFDGRNFILPFEEWELALNSDDRTYLANPVLVPLRALESAQPRKEYFAR